MSVIQFAQYTTARKPQQRPIMTICSGELEARLERIERHCGEIRKANTTLAATLSNEPAQRRINFEEIKTKTNHLHEIMDFFSGMIVIDADSIGKMVLPNRGEAMANSKKACVTIL